MKKIFLVLTLLASALLFPFTSSAEDPEDFYLSCKDREGIFGGKGSIALVRYEKKNELLKIDILNVRAEKDKDFYKASILKRKTFPFTSGNEAYYDFGEKFRTSLEGTINEYNVGISRENLTLSINREFYDCKLISFSKWESSLKKFAKRNGDYLRSRKNHRATKNKI